MEIINKDVIPPQTEGKSSETISSHTCNSEVEAKSFYKIVRDRLLNINEWEKTAGIVSADFVLCDSSGKPVNRQPEKNDHFRIDIPGPGSVTGDGYDWVQVESIEEKEEDDGDRITITVRPATNPTNERRDVAHFFSDSATSSFIAARQGTTVSAAVIGRNEKPNIDTEKKVDTVRNSSVATAAMNGFSKIQWKGLVSGLVKP